MNLLHNHRNNTLRKSFLLSLWLLFLASFTIGSVWLFRYTFSSDKQSYSTIADQLSQTNSSQDVSEFQILVAFPIDLKEEKLETATSSLQNISQYLGSLQLAIHTADLHCLTQLDPLWHPLLDRLEQDGYDRQNMLRLFSTLGPKAYSPAYMAKKVEELHGPNGIGLPRSDDSEQLLPEGYEQPLADTSAQSCYAFLQTHAATLADIRKKYGIPSSIIVSILFVETGLGTNLGTDPALRSLGSMAATTTPQLLGRAGNTKQIKRIAPSSLQNTLTSKSAWAYTELKALIDYCQQHNLAPASIPGSMYGAIGLCQFMPSNIEPYGVDGDGDGYINLFSIVDAMHSVANYLEAHGWRRAQSDKQKMQVIMQYNHDSYYAKQVYGMAKQIALAEQGRLGKGMNPLAFTAAPPAKLLDPSLRRKKPVPKSAQIKTLNSYQEMLQ